MKVSVHYQQRNEFTGDVEGLKEIAMIDCGDRDLLDALEYAFERTQNIYGSWSRGEMVEGQENQDYSEDVIWCEELQKIDGKEYGHRSSMVGDIFTIADCCSTQIKVSAYRVAGMGFEKVDVFKHREQVFAGRRRNKSLEANENIKNHPAYQYQ